MAQQTFPSRRVADTLTTLTADARRLHRLRGDMGRAVGAACRHAVRALEDCYVLTPKSAKADILEGWLTMDAYMRDNKIEPVVPVLPRSEPQQEKENEQ
jgi:hypothetical protein